MSTAKLKQFANALSEIYTRAADLKMEEKSIVEAAKEAGVDTKALVKAAKELATEPDKLAKKYEGERQLELFRGAIGIRERKGLVVMEDA